MPRVDERRSAAARDREFENADPLRRSSVGVQQSLTVPIILALDGSRASEAALRVTAALAARDHAPVEALLVEGAAPAGSMSLRAEAVREAPMSESTRFSRVRQQLCEALETSAWNLHVQVGSFGPVVANLARDTGASLIVLGLRRHRRARRLLGSGAVARVLQSAQIPVLAVPATARELPHAAVAAIDFSPASLRAAREARDLLTRPGTLHLVHVRPAATEDLNEIEGWSAVYSEGVSVQLERLGSELTLEGVEIVPRMAKGPLIHTLLEVARDVDAELIACGTTTLEAFEQVLVGATAIELARRAEYSILIAPDPTSPNGPRESP